MSDTNQTFNMGSVVSDAKSVLLTPVSFYKSMPQSGGLVNSMIFVLVMSAITGVIFAFYSLFGETFGGLGFSLLVLFPILGLIGSFIGGGILFVIWKLMGSEKSYEVSYSCVAYSFAVLPFVTAISFIPYVSGIIKTLWSCFLLFIASKEVHGIKEETAKIVFGVLACIGVLWGIGTESFSRSAAAKVDKFQKEFNIEDFENMSPEEMGENAGKFLQGFNKAIEEANK